MLVHPKKKKKKRNDRKSQTPIEKRLRGPKRERRIGLVAHQDAGRGELGKKP